MSKIDPNANLYDIDGNLISKAPLNNKTISEVEQLVDELTKKVQDNPENEVYKVYLNNAQQFLFGMYNNMSKEDLISRISVLQNSVEKAKSEVNEAEQSKLEEINKVLEELKNSNKELKIYSDGEHVDYEEDEPYLEDPISEASSETKMDEYVEYEEIKE